LKIDAENANNEGHCALPAEFDSKVQLRQDIQLKVPDKLQFLNPKLLPASKLKRSRRTGTLEAFFRLRSVRVSSLTKHSTVV
jgi:hypothetical protein